MKILRRDDGGIWFWCEGCDHAHQFGTSWNITGTDDKPTVSPSILVTYNGEPPSRCHSFIREGRIEYLSDCTHALAGKTVDLPDVVSDATWVIKRADRD